VNLHSRSGKESTRHFLVHMCLIITNERERWAVDVISIRISSFAISIIWKKKLLTKSCVPFTRRYWNIKKFS